MGAVVEPSDSLNVMTTSVLAAFSVTVDSVGGAISGPCVELLVIDALLNERASLPATSCTAALVVDALDVGAVYESVTTWPAEIAVPSVKLIFDPLTVRPVTTTGTPSTSTVKSVVAAVVDPNVSLNVAVSVVPAVLTVPDTKVGGVVSGTTVELLVTGKWLMESKSVPPAS